MISPPHPELAAQLPNSQYRHAPHNATSPHAVESSSSHRGTPPITPPCAETAKDSTPTNMAPVIDPSLDTACLTSTNEKESSLLISPSHGDIPVTSAASSELRSVSTEEARAGRCQASGGTLETAPPSQSPKDPLDEIVEDSERKTEEATSNTEVVDGAGINPRYPPAPVSNPRGMEQILTEDGEPMLNPGEFRYTSSQTEKLTHVQAELLTQVSMMAKATAHDLMSCLQTGITGFSPSMRM